MNAVQKLLDARRVIVELQQSEAELAQDVVEDVMGICGLEVVVQFDDPYIVFGGALFPREINTLSPFTNPNANNATKPETKPDIIFSFVFLYSI